MLQGGLQRDPDPVILFHGLPATKGQPAPGLQGGAQVGEGRHRVVEEHHTEAGKQQVEVARRKGVRGGVRLQEIETRPAAGGSLRLAPRHLKHGCGDVHPQYP